MSEFKNGDRVRARHDHSFEGEVIYAEVPGFVSVATYFPAQGATMPPYTGRVPTPWLERVPEPLEESVPIDVLRKALGEAYAAPGVTAYWDALFAHLRVLGYGKNDD